MSNPALAQESNAAGMAALRAGDATKAVEAFKHAAQADPEALPLWINLAHACRLAGDAKAEQAALERALAVDRTDFTANLRMAQLLQRLGEESRALAAWSGVQQLAAQMPNLVPHVASELDAGLVYSAALQARLYERVDQALGKSSASWDETENRRLRAFVDTAMGKRQVYHNKCAGTFYPFLPQDEYFDRRHFPWLDELEAHHGAIKAELEALLEAPDGTIRPYVQMDPGTPESTWTGLDGSLDWAACFLWEYGRKNLAVTDRCPQTAALLESLPLARIPGRAPNAFFSMLEPHSHIPPHTGVTNTRTIIHLALDIPPGCWFRVGNETREWVEGKAFAFDDTIDHEALNPSDRRRAVLIIDAWNPHLSEGERKALLDYFAAADAALQGTSLLA
ncbi:aspartyl/asparaginyl beta-hydroxylase domain-containing protein [Novosphingobium sp.]|uniref:aspartyl/asparaginyl beta-hydroxylase domain-containing protein n=1 Tax=Novosphingobium sp. TaxID=1874826 RepID=UPI00286D78A0|nr:aspartyl/asparaginyl beta-hydroxylase domain-containing protein [Novosphingobium sp.]